MLSKNHDLAQLEVASALHLRLCWSGVRSDRHAACVCFISTDGMKRCRAWATEIGRKVTIRVHLHKGGAVDFRGQCADLEALYLRICRWAGGAA